MSIAPKVRRNSWLAPAARGRAAAEHRRSRARQSRCRDRRARLHHGGRQIAHQCPRYLRARRLQRARRVHPHRLQRFRDRGGEPARRRGPPRHRPAHGLCALHRSTAGPLRHDRGRGAQIRPSRADRHDADGGCEPRLREGRDRRLHEDPGGQGNEAVFGRALLGLNGDEIVHTILDQMYAKTPYTVMARATHIHPTVTELLPTMLQELRELD